ncbi:hypothetical protein AgCh_029976 [Apium graveolens]
MVIGVDSATIFHMNRSTVKIRFINDPNKLKRFASGFFIGKIGRLAVMFTIGSFVNCMPGIECSESDELEAVCYGSDEAYPCRVELFIPESEILILSCYTRNQIEHFYEFAPRGEWEGEIKGQRVLCMSHCSMREWKVDESIVCSNKYLNGKTVPRCDAELIFFDHWMSMGVGSAGAGILNLNGNVVGMQSGEILTKSAIHIAYLDAVLRNCLSDFVENDGENISLNDLILKYVYHNNYV